MMLIILILGDQNAWQRQYKWRITYFVSHAWGEHRGSGSLWPRTVIRTAFEPGSREWQGQYILKDLPPARSYLPKFLKFPHECPYLEIKYSKHELVRDIWYLSLLTMQNAFSPILRLHNNNSSNITHKSELSVSLLRIKVISSLSAPIKSTEKLIFPI